MRGRLSKPAPKSVSHSVSVASTDVAHTSMPPTSSTTSRTRRPRVPVGLFLAAGCQPGTDRPSPGRLPAWHGATPTAVAEIIRTYTADGDLVVDLDAHPTISAAARFLHRVPATLTTTRLVGRIRLLPAPPDEPNPQQDDAPAPEGGTALVLVTLPRPDAEGADPDGLSRCMQHWRTLLRPGGFLIAVPIAADPSVGRISHRAAIIAAARSAGLRWQQQLLIVAGLPEDEPQTEATPAAGRLVDGRHVPAHRIPLVFTTVEAEVTHV